MTGAFDPAEEKGAHPALRPKDAATLILVKREAEPRVLMGRRPDGAAFMAGKFVFPGGRVEAGDHRAPAASELRPEVLEKVAAGTTPRQARALALAAIRETFEETGVLVGERRYVFPRCRSAAWKGFFAHKVMPRLDGLDLIARAITPPGRSRRFDARFFLADADAIADTADAIDHGELLEPCWLSFAEARALDLPAITRRVLEEAEARLSSGGGPVPFFRFARGKMTLTHL